MTTKLMIAVVCLAGTATAQKVSEKEVPESVVKAFHEKYAGAKAEKWEKETNDYEVEFDWNKKESSASFDANGKFLQYEVEIKTSELPKAVHDYCTQNYKDHKVSEGSKITDAEGKTWYEAELEKGKEEFDLIFDSNGAFVKKETEHDKDEDDKK